MATLDINGQRVEVDDSFLSLPPDQQNATVDEIAASLGAAQPAPEAAPEAPPEEPGILRRLIDPRHGPVATAARTVRDMVTGMPEAAEAFASDIAAGTQGINPVAAAEAVGHAQAIGEVVKQPGMRPYVALYDGSTFAPLSDFPADQFVTHSEHGATYVIPRQATDSAGQPIEEGRLASAGRLAGYGVAERAKAAARPSARAVAATDAEKVGVTPSFAMRGTGAGKVAAAGEQFAPTAKPFQRDAERVTEELGAAAGRIADKAGPGINPSDAGEALKRGGDVYVKGVREFQSNLYGAVDKAIPPETRIGTPETVDYLRGEIAKLAETPNIGRTLGNRELEGWLADLEGATDGISWQTARDLRTKIGEALRDRQGPARDMATGRLKSLYGRLSKDLDAAADAAGPEAKQAWTRANTYTRASEERIKTAFGRILKADTPEKAYDILLGMTAEGGPRANVDGLRKVYQALPADEKATVSGTIIRRMGRARAGGQNVEGDAFSADTFLSNWNRMSPDARRIIADGGLDEGVGEMLTSLARVTERAKQAGSFRNRSNTANAQQTGITIGTIITSLFLGRPDVAAGLIGTAAATRIGAEVLTSPKFLHALNQYATKGQAGGLLRLARSAGEPGALEAAAILRLAAPEQQASPEAQPVQSARGSR